MSATAILTDPIPLTPGPSSRGFYIGLYLEHLEEASFLYEQRLFLLDDPEIAWRDITPFEERFEAHIDALLVGEELALAVCRQQAIEGDFGELHAAVRVFCRQNRFDLLLEVVDTLDTTDDDIRGAVRRAIADEMPDSWKDILLHHFTKHHPFFYTLVPYIFGFRRLDYSEDILHQLSEQPDESPKAHIWALGRLRTPKAVSPLATLLSDYSDSELRKETALALLRCGDSRCISFLKEKSYAYHWPHILLGLCGSRVDAGFLHKVFEHNPSIDALTAIGLLGCKVSVKMLILCLDREEFTKAAAEALYVITGAQLFEEVNIFNDNDIGNDFYTDTHEYENDFFTTSNDIKTGITVKRIARKKERWEAWWNKNESNYHLNIRYRNGRPFDLLCILENIQSELLARRIRQLAYEELVIRYGIDVHFETCMSTGWQIYSIGSLYKLINAYNGNYTPGNWFLARK